MNESKDDALLALLRCPFCGGRLNLVAEKSTRLDDGRLDSGVIWCECCVFPVVAGIPVFKTDDTARAALAHLDEGRAGEALHLLLGLDATRARAFDALIARGNATYREAIALLSPDPEGTYFLYRFSDPTFVMTEAVLAALASQPSGLPGAILDVCGGSGHLAWLLSRLLPGRTVAVSDMFFWKLWLARTFTAPHALTVCCDANQPMPFAAETFQTVILSDAFPYIWHKRLLADEMLRQAGPRGVIVMPHLHSSLGWNYSPGVTLTPQSYARLFENLQPRLFADSVLLTQAIEQGSVDLSEPPPAEALGLENSFTLVASADATLFRRYDVPALPPVTGTLVVNPLYRVAREGDTSVLTLEFPTPAYADEFGDCRRYLPDTLDVPTDLLPSSEPQNPRTPEPENPRTPEPQNPRTPEPENPRTPEPENLRRRRVLVDVPPGYC